MNIDAHQHFWKYTADDYPWISSGMERLARDYLPPDLVKVTQPHDIMGSVAVQARQTIEETEWLLDWQPTTPIYVASWAGWISEALGQ